MRVSRHSVSLGTFGLAFAVVLSPAFLQTSPVSCATGDTKLRVLEFEMLGENHLTLFHPLGRNYYVVPRSPLVDVETAIVRAYPMDLEASVFVYANGGYVMDGVVGGGEVTVDVPPGDSQVVVIVRPPGNASGNYVVYVREKFPCTERGILDAINQGGGPYTFACDGPTTVVTTEAMVIDNDVILDGEGNLTVDGNDDHGVFVVASGVTAEVRGFVVTRGAEEYLGGGIYNNGTLTLTNSTVSGNTAWGGGGIYNEGSLTLTNSTVSGNTAEVGDGGGILNNGMLTLTNSTVSGNTAEVGGGIQNAATLTLTNSTVSGNDASGGGGGILNIGTWSVLNSLVDGDCMGVGVIASNGYNLESPGDTCGFDQATDQVNVTSTQLALGSLQDNGGPTQTHALAPGSFGIGRIPVTDCVDADGMPLTEDQRGVTRPQGIACDVGAVEGADCADRNCNDGNECTDDSCVPASGMCAYPPIPDGNQCDFGGLAGLCIAGMCEEDLCAAVSCDDGNQCTADVCDPKDGICDYPPVEDGTACSLGECLNGVCGTTKAITVGCANNNFGFVSIVPFHLQVDPGPIAAGSPFTADLTGVARYPESFLDLVNSATIFGVPGGLRSIRLIDLAATVSVRSGATGADVELGADTSVLEHRCMETGILCDPANDVPGNGNTDCLPQGSSNSCLPGFVDIPVIDGIPNTAGGCTQPQPSLSIPVPDCNCSACEALDPLGCRPGDPDVPCTKGDQCILNGFCVAGDLPLPLERRTGNYTADPVSGTPILFGWFDGLGATPVPGLLALPPAVFTNPTAPVGMRVYAGGMYFAFQCLMAEDSGGPDGVATCVDGPNAGLPCVAPANNACNSGTDAGQQCDQSSLTACTFGVPATIGCVNSTCGSTAGIAHLCSPTDLASVTPDSRLETFLVP